MRWWEDGYIGRWTQNRWTNEGTERRNDGIEERKRIREGLIID